MLHMDFKITVYQTAYKTKKKGGRSFTFDSDSLVIGVDNHASRTISNNNRFDSNIQHDPERGRGYFNGKGDMYSTLAGTRR